MKINKDFSTAMRGGIKTDKVLFRKEINSGVITSICLILIPVLFILALVLK